MRTTVTLDDRVFDRAQEMTGIQEKAELIRFALAKLVDNEKIRRLRLLGCSDSDAMPPSSRRV